MQSATRPGASEIGTATLLKHTGVTVAVAVGIAVAVTVAVAIGVGVAVTVGIVVAVTVGIAVAVTVAVAIGSGVAVAVGVWSQNSNLRLDRSFSETLFNAVGIHPLSWLPARVNVCRLVRVPRATGMVPVNCLLLRSNLVTRELETVMPSQSVMGIIVLQFREAEPHWVSLIPSSVVQSATRLGASGSGIAVLLMHEMVVFCSATGASAISMRLVMIIADHRQIRTGRTIRAEIRRFSPATFDLDSIAFKALPSILCFRLSVIILASFSILLMSFCT